MPRGVVGSVVFPVPGSINPRSLLSAAWVIRCAHSPTPGISSLTTKQPVVSPAGPPGVVFATEVEHRARPGLVQARRIVVSDRPGRVGFIGPVAVRVEVLGSVQGPPESFHRQALGAVFSVPAGPAGRLQIHRVCDHLALVVEQPRGSVHSFPEPHAHVVHAGHQRGGGLVAGTRIAALEEVGVVAMRRRIRQLVTVGRPDGPELWSVPREIVDGSGSKQYGSEPASPAQDRAARVTRSCSRRWPPVSIVPNAAAEPGADAINIITTRDASSLNRSRCTEQPPAGAPLSGRGGKRIVLHTRWRRPHPGGVTTA